MYVYIYRSIDIYIYMHVWYTYRRYITINKLICVYLDEFCVIQALAQQNHLCTNMYVCISIFLSMYVYVYVYIYTYIHTCALKC